MKSETISDASPGFTFSREPTESLRLWLRFRRRYLRTFFQQILHRKRLSGIEKHCLFIGYPRSGHTLVASLLDAHPNIIISSGVDPLQFFEHGFKLSQLYSLYLKQSKRFAKTDRRSGGYSYVVPNQWHGKFSELKVIGDKSGDLVTERLRTNPDLLDRVLQEYQVEHKFIHVIRNPFDNITTISIRNQIDLGQAVTYYFALCETVLKVRQKIDPANWIDIRHEEIICDPQFMLTKLCHFLGQEPSAAYLEDCAGIVFKSPRKTRYTVPWTPHLIHRVEAKLKKYLLLSAYGFEN